MRWSDGGKASHQVRPGKVIAQRRPAIPTAPRFGMTLREDAGKGLEMAEGRLTRAPGISMSGKAKLRVRPTVWESDHAYQR